ncbi:MAG: tail fiber domain-containing protein [Bacteroidota bacterium]|nr:tail fiber domain-containing protein [Bacteroidota bacterium]
MKNLFSPWLLLPALLLLAAPRLAHAQTGGVRIGTAGVPDASAALDIVSSSKGLLLPRVAAAAGIASPAAGLLVYQTGAPAGFYYNAGTAAAPVWRQIGTTANGDNLGNHTATTNVGLNGNWLSNAAGNANGLRVDNAGNVGVGVAVPTQALDVNGGILARANGLISNQGAHLQWNRSGGTGETLLLNQKGGGPGAMLFGATDAVSSGNNTVTEWARFDGNGNFGLNTNNPGQRLDVNGNANVSGNTTTGGNASVNGPLGVVLNGQDRPLITRGYDVFGSGSYQGAGRWGLFMEPSTLTFGVPAIAGKNFQWATYNANSTLAATLMLLNQSGQLGIGTTTGPATTLDVRTADGTAAITVGSTGATAGAVYLGNPNHGLKRAYNGGNDVGLFTTSGSVYLSANNTSISQFVLQNGGGVGIGTASPVGTALLELASTTKGFLPPRMTKTERDAIGSPAAGLTIYNTSTNKLNTWNGASWDEALSANEQPQPGGPSITFGYTGAAQTYTVPAGVFSLNVDAAGAQGGQSFVGNAFGGPGGRAQATLTVTPGKVLTLYVGGAGSRAPSSATYGGAGYNGGGNGSGGGGSGGGGGASDVRRSGTVPSTNLADRLLVAAGGGGGGEYGGGGAGGGTTGGTGGGGPQPAPGGGTYVNGLPGTGGTQSAGGSGGSPRGNTGGALGIGGSDINDQNGGGGGAGYYGGGAGYRAGGGGGSSWVAPAGGSNVVLTSAYQYGQGSITITPGPAYAAPVLNGTNFTSVASANGLLARGSDNITQQGAHLQWNRSGFEGETWLLNQQGGGGGNAGIRFGKSDQNNNITEFGRFQDNGRFGLGTTNPIAPLHVRGAATTTVATGNASFFNQGGGFNAIGNQSGNKQTTAYFEGGEVWVSGYIVAGNLQTTSDRRIKHVIGLSNPATDLALLNRLRITDYTYIDQVNNTPGTVKKVIAQEVEQVLPTAVTRSTQALPNVYERATRVSFANGELTVTTAKPHELPATGGRMRFYTPTNQSFDPEVTVLDAHTVRFASTEDHAAGLFVYGKYVDDFRSVDYDALTTLNVSATQELARKVAALEAQNKDLQAQHAAAHTELQTVKAQAAADKAQATATLETFEARLRRLEAGGGSDPGGQARK